jgi:hypothetical protein
VRGGGRSKGKRGKKVCLQRENECVRDSRTCSGSRTRRGRAVAGAGASAACVAITAALGQRLNDVEAYGQASSGLERRRDGREMTRGA